MRKPYARPPLAHLTERELVSEALRALSEAKDLFEALEALEEAREDRVRAKLLSIAIRHIEAATRVIAPAELPPSPPQKAL
jgi:hypothetical protein